jgi:hypothetical protein
MRRRGDSLALLESGDASPLPFVSLSCLGVAILSAVILHRFVLFLLAVRRVGGNRNKQKK